MTLVPRPMTVPDVEETGATLEANARLKAAALCAATLEDQQPGHQRGVDRQVGPVSE